MKHCNRCRKTYPLTDFHRNKRQADGLQVWCKTCVNSYQAERRKAEPERYRDYQRTWFLNHPHYYRNYRRHPKPPSTGARVVFED